MDQNASGVFRARGLRLGAAFPLQHFSFSMRWYEINMIFSSVSASNSAVRLPHENSAQLSPFEEDSEMQCEMRTWSFLVYLCTLQTDFGIKCYQLNGSNLHFVAKRQFCLLGTISQYIFLRKLRNLAAKQQLLLYMYGMFTSPGFIKL